jgi:hypothetical protein
MVSPLCDIRAMRYFGFSLIPVCLVFSRWLRRPDPVASIRFVLHCLFLWPRGRPSSEPGRRRRPF